MEGRFGLNLVRSVKSKQMKSNRVAKFRKNKKLCWKGKVIVPYCVVQLEHFYSHTNITEIDLIKSTI